MALPGSACHGAVFDYLLTKPTVLVSEKMSDNLNTYSHRDAEPGKDAISDESSVCHDVASPVIGVAKDKLSNSFGVDSEGAHGVVKPAERHDGHFIGVCERLSMVENAVATGGGNAVTDAVCESTCNVDDSKVKIDTLDNAHEGTG